jgi:hypothetical protein
MVSIPPVNYGPIRMDLSLIAFWPILAMEYGL